jgi:SOS-response transcriptional repressor LexA
MKKPAKKLAEKPVKKLRKLLAKPYLAQVTGMPKDFINPFENGDTVLVLGEIDQMPGHVAVALEDGRVVFGYHVVDFRRIPRDEA